jgi:hypothetical protein
MNNFISKIAQLALGTGLVAGLLAIDPSVARADDSYIIPGTMCNQAYGGTASHYTTNSLEADTVEQAMCGLVRHQNSGKLGTVLVRVYNQTAGTLTCFLVTSNGFGGNLNYIQQTWSSAGYKELSFDGSQLTYYNAGYHYVQCYLPKDGASIEGIKYTEIP